MVPEPIWPVMSLPSTVMPEKTVSAVTAVASL